MIKSYKSNILLMFLISINFLFVSCNSEESLIQETPQDENTDLLQLKVAGYDMDRVQGIVTGKVLIEGCEVEFHKIGIGDANTAAFSGAGTYDVTEIGLHPFMLAYANDNFRDYILLPIPVLRLFRHKSIFIRTDRGINKPADLKGKNIGTPYYSSSSLTWIRGIFEDEYGLKPEDVTWVSASKDSDAKTVGKTSKNEKMVPEGITMISGSLGKDESELLESGEVDALFHASEPKAFVQGKPNIGRLFPDYKNVEQAYFKKNRCFPNHACRCCSQKFVGKRSGSGQSHL